VEQELVYNMGISSPSYFRTPSPPHPTAHTKLSITRRHPIHDHISTLRCRRARRRRGRTILVARSGGGEGAFPPSLAPELDSGAGRRKSASCGILEAINSLTLGMLACSR
jgi:hypothetical protein